ncbi:MAG: arsenate reductase family protein [Bacteroidota bacterium]|nr:arsenate reductase family protein [Bacteroidota bacterium]
MKIYHNPRCKKSRAGLAYLEDKKITFEKVLYLKDRPFNEVSLSKLLTKMGKKPHDMIRTQEKLYKQDYKGQTLSDKDWVTVMVENPRFIQRPIVETEDNAVWGDPPENIDHLL